MSRRRWYLLTERDLRWLLGQVEAGGDPDTVLIEWYANSRHEIVGRDAQS